MKKQTLSVKMLIALCLVVLASFCLVGSTLARYTSGANGSSTVNVARWDVNTTTAEEATLTFKMSPSKAAFAAGEVRTNSTNKTLAATITNNSDVDALVTVTLGDVVATLLSGKAYGAGMAADALTTAPTKAQVEGLFSFKLFVKVNNAADFTEVTGSTYSVNLTAKEAGQDAQKVEIYVVATWTSADEGETTGTLADALDTWVGENVEKVNVNLTYTAVQNSTL